MLILCKKKRTVEVLILKCPCFWRDVHIVQLKKTSFWSSEMMIMQDVIPKKVNSTENSWIDHDSKTTKTYV